MGDPTPQTEALTNKLLESDDHIAAFKSDPKPLLDEHGVALDDTQHAELREHLAQHDVPTLRHHLQREGVSCMFHAQA